MENADASAVIGDPKMKFFQKENKNFNKFVSYCLSVCLPHRSLVYQKLSRRSPEPQLFRQPSYKILCKY